MGRHLRRVGLVAAAVSLGLGACTSAPPAQTSTPAPSSARAASSGADSAAYPTSTAPRPTAPAAPGTPTTPPAPGAVGNGRITIAFGGDVHFERHVKALLDRPDGLAELQPLLGTADVAVVNLETAITTRGTPEPKSFTFRAPPSALTTLAAAGVDVAGMANNHAVDYGPQGLADTLAAKDASPIPVIGVGRTAAEAFAPAVLNVRGTSVAVIASTQVGDLTATKFPASDAKPGVAANLDNSRLLAAVRAARAKFDVVVVFLHWGTERTTCPDPRQFATAAALEKAGADIIVGGHHHRVLGAGWLGRAYVGYGLGNFVWWLNTNTPADAATGVLTVEIDSAAVAARAATPREQWAGLPSVVVADHYAPLTISAKDGVPRAAAKPTARLAEWEAARACTNLKGTP